jgi:hypothetical protein
VRTQQLITSYIQATLFFVLGIRAVIGWIRRRDSASAHLAWATGLFGISSLIGAISGTIYDATKGQTAPVWLTIISTALIYLAIYGFLVFLGDFLPFNRVIRELFRIATIVGITFAVIMRPAFKFKPPAALVCVRGPHDPLPCRAYVGGILVYFALVFAILWVSFIINAFRVRGLARFRMVSIAGGFFLLFVAIGLIPRLLFGKIPSQTAQDLSTTVGYIALASAPLLLFGFTPPTWLNKAFGQPEP